MLTTILLCLAGWMLQNTEPVDVQFEPNHIKVAGQNFPYQLLVPKDQSISHPLVVFLHGAGERGENNTSQLRRLPNQFITDDHLKNKPCYVLAMQCPRGDQWASYKSNRLQPGPPREPMKALIEAIRTVVSEKNVDTSRIYLTGLSMGGYGSWELAALRPSWFAAVVPICGGGHIPTAEKLVGLPLWAFHGTADSVVPEQASVRMINAIRKSGGRPAYTPLEDVGHNSWSFAYGPHGAMEWMFAQQNPDPPEFDVSKDNGAAAP
jgi:predicted peptidase